jgi:streptomycin 6-kinase
VLKVAWAHEESRDEAAGMRAWQGRGAARLFRSARDGDTVALLLERVRPGVPLAQLLTWPERDEVIAGVARRLWVPPAQLVGCGATDGAKASDGSAGEDGSAGPAGADGAAGEESAYGFRPLAHMCAWWADQAHEKGAGERAGLPRELVERGLELFRSLPLQWDGEEVLLATDLHPGNVLSGGAVEEGAVEEGAVDGGAYGEGGGGGSDVSGRRWVLIDPKPYVGDPHYDLLQHMLNDMDRLRADPGGFAERMADLAGLDRRRARQWLLARSVQEAGEFGGLVEVALRLAADEGW